ncbi:MAG: fatty acid desaturase [Chitinophagales bacterium]|nr:fatty acid desaturase [Chitinophagales bacterium]
MHIDAITINDPVFVRKEQKNAIDRFFLKLIRDERDLPFIYLSLRILFITVPIAILLYVPGFFSWYIAVPYLVANSLFNLGPFVLMLHNVSHRKLFKKEYEWMNQIIPWVIGPFFGESPETYYSHHVGMHHPENNLGNDLSSTMRFQRDSLIDFMRYFLRFFFFVLIEITEYFRRRRRWEFLRNTLIGEFSFYAFCALLCLVSWKATLAVFILPYLIIRFAMMAGNWGQHAFIDAADPGNSYKNSITCINSVYNKTCFNDGYHIGHHLRPALHWTELPKDFQKHKAEYAANRAIVFEGLDFFVIWFLLMTKNYKALAKKFVHLDDRLKTEAEVIAFLKERTRRIPKDVIEHFSTQAMLGNTRRTRQPVVG